MCAVSDINLDGLCPECAEEEKERLEKEELEKDENTLKNEKGNIA